MTSAIHLRCSDMLSFLSFLTSKVECSLGEHSCFVVFFLKRWFHSVNDDIIQNLCNFCILVILMFMLIERVFRWDNMHALVHCYSIWVRVSWFTFIISLNSVRNKTHIMGQVLYLWCAFSSVLLFKVPHSAYKYYSSPVTC